jgi:hypothetical protein
MLAIGQVRGGWGRGSAKINPLLSLFVNFLGLFIKLLGQAANIAAGLWFATNLRAAVWPPSINEKRRLAVPNGANAPSFYAFSSRDRDHVARKRSRACTQ